MGVNAGFQIIARHVGVLGLGSEPHVVGQLGSDPEEAVFWVGAFSGGVASSGGYLLESRDTTWWKVELGALHAHHHHHHHHQLPSSDARLSID